MPFPPIFPDKLIVKPAQVLNCSIVNCRFSIVQDEAGFSLSIAPTRSDDSGVYFCLVNGAEEPTRGLRLAVQVATLAIITIGCLLIFIVIVSS